MTARSGHHATSNIMTTTKVACSTAMKVVPAVDATRRVLLALISPLFSSASPHPPVASWLTPAPASRLRTSTPAFLLSSHPAMMSSSSSGPNEGVTKTATTTTSDSNRGVSTGVLLRTANIVALSDPNDEANAALLNARLPPGCTLLGAGATLQEVRATTKQSFDLDSVNAVFVSHPKAREPLAQLLEDCPNVEWIHTRSAGIDFVTSPALASFGGVVTNAKGQFSSTLAEYTMLAIGYFAKDLPRLSRNKINKVWDKYDVLEIKKSTLGIVGYGDIGRAAAKLAKAYGMSVHAVVRRRSSRTESDPFVDVLYGNTREELHRLFAESDYVLCAAPLTTETKGLIGKSCFDHAKSGAVFINVGRGPIVDEVELVRALEDGRLRGAALDVFEMEPLPESSPLWTLDNVLLSPHNMDKTATFMHESTEFYVNEQLPRFVRGVPLLNVVDPKAGYKDRCRDVSESCYTTYVYIRHSLNCVHIT